MASPFLQKLPKSPLSGKKSPLLRSLASGLPTPRLRLSPDTCWTPDQLSNSPETEIKSHPRSAGAASPLLRPPREKRTSFSCTPTGSRSLLKNPSPAFLGSPSITLQFSATQNCEALIHSPCRSENYSLQRRRLYHQDSPVKLSSLSETLAQPVGSLCLGRRLPIPSIRTDSQSSEPSSGSSGNTPRIGNGGFGSVFIGKYDGQRAAIKQLHSRSSKDRAKEESFCAELNAFRLCHPNIVRILSFTSCGTKTQVVFEYAGPRNLQQILDDTDTEAIGAGRRLRWLTELGDALAYCHSQRILHLDVKPANVLVAEDDSCKLADFGCSRSLPPDSESAPATPVTASFAGTLIYKAPELLKGQSATAKADVYSFSLLMWQCLTRQIPFVDCHPHSVVFLVVSRDLRPPVPPPTQVLSDSDSSLFALIQLCWLRNPEERPESHTVHQRLLRIFQAES